MPANPAQLDRMSEPAKDTPNFHAMEGRKTMRIVDLEILNECTKLSPAVTGPALSLALIVWLTGWRWQRFWMTAGLTISAGMIGLMSGSETGQAGDQTIAVALLLAVAAGILTSELCRLLAFAVGGASLTLIVRVILPEAHELTAVFILGGLAGVLMYRFWIVLFTSFLGAIVFWHATLGLLSHFLGLDVTDWAERKYVVLNTIVLTAGFLGMAAQFYLERRGGSKGGGDKPKEAKKPDGGAPKWVEKLKIWKNAA